MSFISEYTAANKEVLTVYASVAMVAGLATGKPAVAIVTVTETVLTLATGDNTVVSIESTSAHCGVK